MVNYSHHIQTKHDTFEIYRIIRQLGLVFTKNFLGAKDCVTKVSQMVASVSKLNLDDQEKFANKEKQEWDIFLVFTECTIHYKYYWLCIIYSQEDYCALWCMNFNTNECRFCFQTNDVHKVSQKIKPYLHILSLNVFIFGTPFTILQYTHSSDQAFQ